MKYLRHPLVKIIISLLILYLLWRNNLLSWKEISNAQYWQYYLVVVAFFPLAVLLGAYRLRTLFQAQGNILPMKKLFSWNMISLFLASAFPTSAASEIVRYAYIADYLPKEGRLKIATVILIDRGISLLSIFFLASFTGLIFWKDISQVPQLASVVVFSVVLSLCSLGGLIFFGASWNQTWFKKLTNKIPLGKYIYEFTGYFYTMNQNPMAWVKVFGANILTHLIYTVSWFFTLYTFGISVDIPIASVIFPYIPICLLFGFAGGIGLGTASAGFLLTEFLLVPSGSSVVLFSQGMALITAVLGGLPFYLLEKRTQK